MANPDRLRSWFNEMPPEQARHMLDRFDEMMAEWDSYQANTGTGGDPEAHELARDWIRHGLETRSADETL